jgi:hypothetical protein
MIDEPLAFRTRVFVILLGVAVAAFVINQVRRRKIKEQYALLWIMTAVLFVLIPLLIDVVNAISYALGILYPPAFIFMIALICVILLLFQFSMSISKFSEQLTVLIQDIALLTRRVEELESNRADNAKDEVNAEDSETNAQPE